MAPIPIRLPEEALSLISSAEQRYRHINESEVTNLRNCRGPLTTQQALAEEVRGSTTLLTQQIQDLELLVDDLQGEKNRRELRRIVDDFKTKLESLRNDTRAALLTSQRVIDSQRKSNREELLSTPSVVKEESANEKSSDDLLMKANSDVTGALRRTIATMQNELERSVLSTQLLDASSSSLRATSLQHDTLSSFMSTSKHLITALEKSDWLDRMLILSAFAFFVLVVLFVLKQRMVDRGLRIAFWWTKYLPDFGADEAVLENLENVKSDVASSSSSGTFIASVTSSTVVPVSTAISSVLSDAIRSIPTVASSLAIGTPSDSTLVEIPTHVEL